MEQKKITFDTDCIKLFKDRLLLERAERLKNATLPLQFGISYLDDALGGVFKNDLILIGAYSGIGKTELVTNIAMKNAGLGKRVHFFALEAEQMEIERRIKYKMLSEMFYKTLRSKYQHIQFDFSEWYAGKLDKIIGDYEPEIEKLLLDLYPTLSTIYRDGGDYTVEKFEKQFLAIQDQTDLVIIDHLHYFDSEDPNENRALRNIIKKLRDTALLIGKPIILVAHVRKRERKIKQLVPELEDFHGTSDIGKIATRAITIGQSKELSLDKTKVVTYFKIVKNRLASNRTRFVAITNFDISNNMYDKKYLLGTEEPDGEFILADKNDVPFWAINSKQRELKK